ncbi:hypothetical protein [Treponema primitia]|uniref:hypothetical protein n=1 Tax=Treponema primitia TaxID=88058 RepID=UPI000255523F|nr:hypothetical protein [Treponema primitia]
MNCVNHPDREAVGLCTHCGQFFCKDCLVPVKGKMVCKNDVDKVLNEATTDVSKETRMEAQMQALKDAANQKQSPIIISNNNNNSASSSAAASAAAAASGGVGGYYRSRRMHWLYFFLVGWWLGLVLVCFIIPLFIRGLVKKAFGYW